MWTRLSFNFRYLWLGSILFLENSKVITHAQQTKNIVISCYLLAVSFRHISDKPFPKHSTTYRRQEEKWTEKIWMNFWLNSGIRCDSSWLASVLNRLLRRVLQCKWTIFVSWKPENVFLLACNVLMLLCHCYGWNKYNYRQNSHFFSNK